MIKKELDVPSVKTSVHTFKITDFDIYTEFSLNFFADKELKSVNHKLSTVTTIPANVNKGYFLDDRIIFYTRDKCLHEYIISSVKKLEDCSGQPALLPVMVGGEKQMVVITSTESYLLGNNQLKYSVPKGSYVANYKNKAFISQSKNLYFSGEFDLETLSMDIENLGFVSVPTLDGNIIGLIPYEDDLMVFCQKSIYKLHISASNEMSFTKSNAYKIEIKANSIVKVGNEIFFISNENLCSYKNGKIERHKTNYEEFLFSSTLVSGAINEYYAKPFKKDGETYIYLYDTINKRSHLIEGQGSEFIGDNYLINKTARYLYQITNGKPSYLSWTSKKMNFGNYCKKKILEIGICSSTDAVCYVYSSIGYRCFTIRQGYNYQKLNLVGDEFYFNIHAYTDELTISDFKIKYKTIGE